MTSVTLWLLTCTTISVAASTFLCCDAFIFTYNCPAHEPCTCSRSGSYSANIHCQRKNLNATPHFLRSETSVPVIGVTLSNNYLITISDYAFKNLSSYNASRINIDLSYNKISTISRYAFSGIENVIDFIVLKGNNLSSIPKSVGNLRALKALFVENNPLTSLGVSSLSEIGNTLQTLRIDLQDISAWPTEFGFLHTLKSLRIRYMNFPHLNSEAFRGFESSLTSLRIEYATTLDKIPKAICQLSNLKTLTLQHFNNLNENSTSIFHRCTEKLNNVTSLVMQYSNLTKFPDVFYNFPSITSLKLAKNSLDFIETDKIPRNNVLSSIDLDRNRFKRIPNSLNRCKHLTFLILNNNYIVSVEENDLSGLIHLQRLYLSNNPITAISSLAFRNSKELAALDLRNTYLTNVPAAIMSLPKLFNLLITNTHDPIRCTCELSYLKGWNVSAVASFNSKCASPDVRIKDYIKSSLQQCP